MSIIAVQFISMQDFITTELISISDKTIPPENSDKSQQPAGISYFSAIAMMLLL